MIFKISMLDSQERLAFFIHLNFMIMNWLEKLFKKKKKTYNKLLIIDDSKELIHEILGISDERAEELLNICLKAYDNNTHVHTCLEDVVSECKHTNEVVMATLMMQKVIDRKTQMNGLMGALKNMFGNG
jgi:hypothetical protein